MDLEFIKLRLEEIKKQFDYVKDQETFVITTKTVEFLIYSLKNVINEYETIRKHRTWYKNRYERLQSELDSILFKELIEQGSEQNEH